MLHHIEIYVSNLVVSRLFWVSILEKIGYELTDSWNDGFTLSNGKDGYLTFVQVSNKYNTVSYHRCRVGLNHLAFCVADRAAVDSLRQYCVDEGIAILYDDRYPFANGGDDYFALFIEDPDRIKVEFVVA